MTTRLVLAVVLCLASVPPVGGADQPPQSLQTARLLGGAFTLALAGVPADVPRAEMLPTLIRHLHRVRPDDDAETAGTLRSVVDALTMLGDADGLAADWQDGLSLPIGKSAQARRRVEDAVRLLGLELREQRNVFSVRDDGGDEARHRRDVLSRAGVPIEAYVADLNAGKAVRISVPSIAVPLPLPRAVWATLLERAIPESAWVAVVLQDRRASVLAYGLLGAPASTRAFMAAQPKLLGQMYERPAAFALAAPAVAVRGGAVIVPGGQAGVAAWEGLVGASPTDPDRFLRALVEKDDGEAAYVFRVLSELDPPHQRFAFGGGAPTRDALKRLYEAIPDRRSAFLLEDRPFTLRRMDGGVILRLVAVSSTGELLGPRWVKLWEEVFASSDVATKGDSLVKALRKPAGLDAVGLLQLVMPAPPAERIHRLQTFLLAQRRFPAPRDGDAVDLLVSLRSLEAFPALGPLLDRIGVSGPSVFASLVRAAARASAGSDEARPYALLQLQGGIALVDRLRISGALSPAAAERALSQLAACPLDADGWYRGRVAEWLGSVVEQTAAGPSPDQRLVAGLAGVGLERPGRFEWESEPYVVARAAVARRRIDTALGARRAAAVTQVLTLASAIRATAGTATVEGIPAAVQALDAALGSTAPTTVPLERARELERAARGSVTELRGVRRAADLRKVADRLQAPERWLDALAAGVLRDLVYAASGQSEDASATLELAGRHDLNLEEPVEAFRPAAPWQPPKEDASGTLRLQGSLLGLDVALVRQAPRRVSTDLPAGARMLGGVAQSVLTEAIVIAGTREATDAQRDAIAAALARGTERFDAAVRDADPAEALRGVPTLSPVRREALAWTVANVPAEASQHVSAADLFAMGDGDAAVFASWGASQFEATGCLCLGRTIAAPWEGIGGRVGAADVEASNVELMLRLAAHLARLKVPAALLPPVVAFAVSDAIEEAHVLGDDDSMGLVRAARRLTQQRVEDYVAAAVGRGFAVLDEAGAR